MYTINQDQKLLKSEYSTAEENRHERKPTNNTIQLINKAISQKRITTKHSLKSSTGFRTTYSSTQPDRITDRSNSQKKIKNREERNKLYNHPKQIVMPSHSIYNKKTAAVAKLSHLRLFNEF